MALAALSLAGCGYVGDPLPPRLEIPKQIEDLRGVQRGDQLIVVFTPTLEATDKTFLKELRDVELRIGPVPEGGFDMGRWAAGATRLKVADFAAGTHEMQTTATPWAGKDVVIAVRTQGPRSRYSDWSNVLAMHVVAPLERPSGLKATPDARGPYLQWSGAGTSFRVWRLTEGEQTPVILGVSGEPAWLDAGVEAGKTYTYTVQQLAGETGKEAESELSPQLMYRHDDVFPPAVPAGLQALAALQTIELSWDRNAESDLAGYHVYRAEGSGELKRIGALLGQASYSDKAVESGKRYRYAVSAVDEKGNESKASAAVEIAAP